MSISNSQNNFNINSSDLNHSSFTIDGLDGHHFNFKDKILWNTICQFSKVKWKWGVRKISDKLSKARFEKFLLHAREVNTNIASEMQYTLNTALLLSAIVNDDDESIEKLVAIGANVNDYTINSSNIRKLMIPLSFLCTAGLYPLYLYLMIKLHNRPSLHSQSLLQCAVEMKKNNAVKALLKNGANLNEQSASYDGGTIFHYAARTGNIDSINLFLDYLEQNQPNGLTESLAAITDENGFTPMHIAATRSLEATKAFLERGVHPDIQSNDIRLNGMTPLYFSNDSDIIKELIKHGADINFKTDITDYDFYSSHYNILQATPFDFHMIRIYKMLISRPSESKKYIKAIETLVKNGSEINKGVVFSNADTYYNPCYLFVLVMQLFLSKNSFQFSTTYSEIFDLIKFFIPLVDNLNLEETENFDTILILAARNKNYKLFQLLLDAGADFTIKNNEGKTALDYLSDRKRKKIVKKYNKLRDKTKRELDSLDIQTSSNPRTYLIPDIKKIISDYCFLEGLYEPSQLK